ncbi:8693_t:CDS:10 [Ambispora gerdemannii]|uniref:8693_t:CDS:1 n=1 Tax=Ambispora gerdemannii TaxID=144530 RepID=A0A9N9F081_9GLOM|nr:8693_t:CDS:10 [Ambispora gerdemannii]
MNNKPPTFPEKKKALSANSLPKPARRRTAFTEKAIHDYDNNPFLTKSHITKMEAETSKQPTLPQKDNNNNNVERNVSPIPTASTIREVPSRYMQSLSTQNHQQKQQSTGISNKKNLNENTLRSSKSKEATNPVSGVAAVTHRGLFNSRSTLSSVEIAKTSLAKKREDTLRSLNAMKKAAKDTAGSETAKKQSSLSSQSSAPTNNFKASQSFECQKQAVEAQLLEAWELFLQKQKEFDEAKRRFELAQEMLLLQETLSVQRDQLLQVIQDLENFKMRYIPFASSLESTTTAMPIPNVEIGNLDALSSQINECCEAVSKVMETTTLASAMIHEVAQLMHHLCVNIKEEIQELGICNSLILEISKAETLERSMRIQMIEAASNSRL